MGDDLPVWARPRFGLGTVAPSRSTIGRVLHLVDPDVLDAVLSAWTATRAARAATAAGVLDPGGERRVVAVDGTAARGARRPDGSRVHLVAAVDHATGTVLGQVATGAKGGEIAAFKTVLHRFDLHGCVVTADALHTQTAHAHYLHRHGGFYVFTVKGNQPSLHAQLESLPWAGVRAAHENSEVGHGRVESRRIKIVSLGGAGRLGFPHARLAIRIDRERREQRTRQGARETVYAVTNLDWGQTSPAELAAIIRGHWVIENRLHWVRDVTFAEDAHQLRGPTAPHVMATLRNTASNLLRTAGTTSIRAARATTGRRVERVLDLLEHEPVTTNTRR